MEPDGGADEDLDIGGGGASAVQADWLEGMDPKSTFMLNFKHLGNPKKTRKDLRCFCFEKIVDSDRTNLKDLIQSIIEQYPPGYMEVAHLQYHDHILKSFPQGLSQQLSNVVQVVWPYLAIDSTFLTGKYKGQLASASDAIGSPNSLAICTDAGQAIMNGVKEVFPQVEHRECMFHLVTNFKKKFHGKVFDDHLWAAAYSWNPYVFEKHWLAMEKEKPATTAYLRKCHSRLWTRSQFSTRSKVDYVTNNLAESFNNWIKEHKSLNLDDFLDKIRQLLMSKWNQRRKISRKLDGLILPHIIKKLNEQSRELELEVKECSEEVGEVTALGGSGFRFVVNLLDRTCSCRQWQVSRIPCRHAIAFITSLSNAALDNYVDPYYSVDKFRVAYAQLIPAMPDKTQWPKATHEFFMYPPL
ncbi:uncharacterized protein, partial [Miscanthus floridulus]|uniref:uncharacterized protein n=1 Tax=Miscanthus floridulus TaxID=154761 RepID=UPI003458A8BA